MSISSSLSEERHDPKGPQRRDPRLILRAAAVLELLFEQRLQVAVHPHERGLGQALGAIVERLLGQAIIAIALVERLSRAAAATPATTGAPSSTAKASPSSS